MDKKLEHLKNAIEYLAWAIETISDSLDEATRSSVSSDLRKVYNSLRDSKC